LRNSTLKLQSFQTQWKIIKANAEVFDKKEILNGSTEILPRAFSKLDILTMPSLNVMLKIYRKTQTLYTESKTTKHMMHTIYNTYDGIKMCACNELLKISLYNNIANTQTINLPIREIEVIKSCSSFIVKTFRAFLKKKYYITQMCDVLLTSPL
jgi:hypothetical protein